MLPHPVDVHVGTKLRYKRKLLGISQEELGEAVGVTFQQIQKYERGLNRISSSRLYEFAQILKTDIAFFFDGLSEHPKSSKVDPSQIESDYSQLMDKEILTLVKAYNQISDTRIRSRILALIKVLGDEGTSRVGES